MVERTKNRPIASGQISVKLSLVLVLLLCVTAFVILIQFNLNTIILGLASMPFAFTYPLMKRFTYWPQLFLGVTFNFGLLLGWTSIKGEIDIIPIILYLGAIFWTLGYDTIYGFQDIEDDEIIGVKSTSIKFKQNPKIFLSICYFIFTLLFVVSGIRLNFNYYFFLGAMAVLFHLLVIQIMSFDKEDKEKCLKIFKSNNILGLIILICILIAKFN